MVDSSTHTCSSIPAPSYTSTLSSLLTHSSTPTQSSTPTHSYTMTNFSTLNHFITLTYSSTPTRGIQRGGAKYGDIQCRI